jgi:hypothetical protein
LAGGTARVSGEDRKEVNGGGGFFSLPRSLLIILYRADRFFFIER